MNKIKKHFALAIKAAEKGDSKDASRHFRIGAVAIRSDGALVSASNIPNREPDSESHAEARLTKKLDHNAEVFVVRIGRGGELRNARPCKRCRQKLKSRKIKKCYYSIANDEYGVMEL